MLEIRRGDEDQCAGGRVDGEKGRICSAGDAVGRRCPIGVRRPTVVTAVVFSAMVIEAAAPPPFELITGVLSFSFVTATDRVWLSVLTPSVARTITS